jgi:ribosomal protein L32
LVESDRRREDEWFLKNEEKLIQAAREAREKRERERAALEQQAERERLKALHFMKCPKCGHDMKEQILQGITIDACTHCEGVYFDAGELDQLMMKREEDRRGILRKLIGV